MTMLIGVSCFLSTAGWHHVCVLRGNKVFGRLGMAMARAIFNSTYTTSSSISNNGITESSLHSGVNATHGVTQSRSYSSINDVTSSNISAAIPVSTEKSTEVGITADKVRIKKSTLYTRTGDKGFSSLYNGERRSKSDMIFHALGHQDELNAVLGVVREHCNVASNGLNDMLIEIQCRLFDVGAAIATPINRSSEEKIAFTKFPDHHTVRLEQWIDELDHALPPLSNFVIPSGGMSATYMNLARTVCRRTERSVVPLVEMGLVDAEVGRYLNRLSDLLFAAARTAVMREGRTEIIWRKSE